MIESPYLRDHVSNPSLSAKLRLLAAGLCYGFVWQANTFFDCACL